METCADPTGDPDDVEMHMAEANVERVDDLDEALDVLGLEKDYGDKPYERLRRLAQRYTISNNCNSVAWTKLMHQHMAMCVCSMAERLAESGTLLHRQGNYKGSKVSKKWEILEPILALIDDGRPWKGLGKHPFRSLEELVEVHPVVEDYMELLCITTLPSLWRLLRQIVPGLDNKCKMVIKADREPKQAMHAAAQISGKKPMDFTADIFSAHPLTKRVQDEGYQYQYKFEQLLHNVYLDAGKAEPHKWVITQKVISSPGYRHTHRGVASALIMKTVRPMKYRHFRNVSSEWIDDVKLAD